MYLINGFDRSPGFGSDLPTGLGPAQGGGGGGGGSLHFSGIRAYV